MTHCDNLSKNLKAGGLFKLERLAVNADSELDCIVKLELPIHLQRLASA